MQLPPPERAMIDRELDLVGAARESAWNDLAVPLDPDDLESRLRWAKAREDFCSETGPLIPDSHDRAALAAMKDRYRGERAFVIGNGPSLNRTPLHLLEDEFTFGVNRIYLLFDRIAWRPTFYTTLDWRFVPDCADEVNALRGMQFFFPQRFRGLLRDGDDVAWYWNDRHIHPSQRGFASDASLGIRGAGSVTGAAIQLAFHLGFDPIYLIGCDVSYAVPDSVIQEGPDKFGTGVGLYLTSTQDDDANHFDKRYFGAGKRWHDPNVRRMIQGFEQCREGAERHGRSIYNATVGGNLEVFDRVDIRTLFAAPAATPAPPQPSLASFIAASLNEGSDDLMVDIGAGRGTHLAPFAALGWEVRAFEPDASQRRELVASCPPEWHLFVDPRAIDARTGAVDHFRLNTAPGLFLTPVFPNMETAGRAVAVTPEEALEPLDGRVPAVVAIEANCWEHEILRNWPWASCTPEFLIVGIDDTVSGQLGFDRRSMVDTLQSHGYQVVVVEADRPFVPGPDWLGDRAGGPCTMVACPDTLQLSDAVLEVLGRAHAVVVASIPSASTGSPSGDVETGPDFAQELMKELAELRASTSWRLGSGLVQAGARSRDRVEGARQQLRRMASRPDS